MFHSTLTMRERGHHGRNWTTEDDGAIRRLFAEGAYLNDVAKLLGRSQEAVRTRANLLHIPVRSAPRAQMQSRLRIPA